MSGDLTPCRQVIARPSIPISTGCLVKSEDIDKWEHLRGIDIPVFPDGSKVQMLIGQDCSFLC